MLLFFYFSFEKRERLRLEEEARKKEEVERERRLNALINEETEYQQQNYEGVIARILNGLNPASPRFIAQFRLTVPLIVNNNMLNDECTICLENFQLGESYARWPCAGEHTFHFDCMLRTLRAGNKCPLCRHPVETLPLPSFTDILQLRLNRMWTGLMNPRATQLQ